jgi:hypothetical protein
MKKILSFAAIAASAIAVTACGGSAATWPPSMRSALQQSGCAHMTSLYHSEMFTAASAECTLNGTPAEIAVFPGPASQKQWEAAAKAFGAEILKDGDLWAVSSQ